jgi:hypothetical protein
MTYNSSRQRIGEPIASQSAKSIQMVEKDFSPPERVFVALPLSLLRVISGSTYVVLVGMTCYMYKVTNVNIKLFIAMFNDERSSKLSLRE